MRKKIVMIMCFLMLFLSSNTMSEGMPVIVWNTPALVTTVTPTPTPAIDSAPSISSKLIEMVPSAMISAGGRHAIGLKSDGSVLAAGNNEFEQCDVGKWTEIAAVYTTKSQLSYFTLGLRSDGSIVYTGYDPTPGFPSWLERNINSLNNIVSVSVSGSHIVCLRNDGTVIAGGYNDHGECDVSSWQDILAISAGYYHTVGLRKDGIVVATGDNIYGECDIESWQDIIAISAGQWRTMGLRKDGTAVLVGWGMMDDLSEDVATAEEAVSRWRNVVAISVGGEHVLGLLSDGTVVAAGSNRHHECEVKDWKNIIAISAADRQSVALCSDGTVVATGDNEDGQCNLNDWMLF